MEDLRISSAAAPYAFRDDEGLGHLKRSLSREVEKEIPNNDAGENGFVIADWRTASSSLPVSLLRICSSAIRKRIGQRPTQRLKGLSVKLSNGFRVVDFLRLRK